MQSLRGGQIILRTRVLDLSSEPFEFLSSFSADGNRDLLEAVRRFPLPIQVDLETKWDRAPLYSGESSFSALGFARLHAILLEIVLNSAA